MNELATEAMKAVIWVSIGILPTMFGVGIVLWSDVRSLKKAINSAFAKIRALEGYDEECQERKNR